MAPDLGGSARTRHDVLMSVVKKRSSGQSVPAPMFGRPRGPGQARLRLNGGLCHRSLIRSGYSSGLLPQRRESLRLPSLNAAMPSSRSASVFMTCAIRGGGGDCERLLGLAAGAVIVACPEPDAGEERQGPGDTGYMLRPAKKCERSLEHLAPGGLREPFLIVRSQTYVHACPWLRQARKRARASSS